RASSLDAKYAQFCEAGLLHVEAEALQPAHEISEEKMARRSPGRPLFLTPVDYKCDRAITRMHDDNLISRDKETVLTKFRHPIQHDRSEPMKLHAFGDFRPECQAQTHVHHGEIWRDAVAHQRYLSLTQTKPLRYLWPTLAPISRIDYIDDHVGSRIDDANVVVHHEVAVVAIIREEHKYSTRDAEQ